MQPAVQHVGHSSGAVTTQSGEYERWSRSTKLSFRFAFCYLTLYLSYVLIHHAEAPVPVIGTPYVELWNSLTSWIGVHLFGFGLQDLAGAGGDALSEYLLILIFFVLAVAGALVWSLLDRTREHYNALHAWLRLAVRYSVVFIMLDYGFGKVFALQFKPPKFWTMLSPFGEFTPANVLWEFMGVSQAYTVFTGGVEVLGALLLLSGRTTTIGALVCSAALVNVVMLNLCYDVGVKVYSIHLLLMSMFLLAPEVKPLTDVLVFRKAATPAYLPTVRFSSRWAGILGNLLWVMFVASVLYKNIASGWSYFQSAYIRPEQPAVYGLFEVETFNRSGREVPPLATETARWQRISFDTSWSGRGPGYVHVRTMEESPNQWTRFRFRVESDASRNTITLVGGRDKTGQAVRNTFTYSRPDPTHVVLDGNLGNERLVMRLRNIDTSQYVLAKRRFRWIQPNAHGRPDWSRIR